jgi:hypothetical protein
MRRHVHGVRIVTIISLACASLCFACAGHPTEPGHVRLGQSFDLRPGASTILPEGLKLTFDRVKSESRCPMDALCVWAGDAIITVMLSDPSGTRVERELHTMAGGSEAAYRGYVINLAALAPYPQSDRKIQPGDYVATFTVAAH